jgi:DNA-binding CsgD family transcriptional regulator
MPDTRLPGGGLSRAGDAWSLGVVGARASSAREARLPAGFPLSLDGSFRRPHLTGRELDVLELLASGLSTQKIAEALWVSPQAVSYHLGNMYAKFGCENRAGLVARAFVARVLSVEEWPPHATHVRGTLRDRVMKR